MLRCFLGQDMCKFIRFIESCSCNNLECRLNKPALIIKKQVMINDIIINNVYIVNIYFVDIKKQSFIKTSIEIQSQIILDIVKIISDSLLEYPAVFIKHIKKDEMICNLKDLDLDLDY
jgi:hypothetical protein